MKLKLPKHDEERIRQIFCWLPITSVMDEYTYWLTYVWIREVYKRWPLYSSWITVRVSKERDKVI